MAIEEVMIRAERLTKAFGPRVVVRDVSFACRPGEVVAFLGPNGAGKTTTMRMLTGYLPPTSGTASVAGYDTLTDSMNVRRRLGYMPETVPLYPEMRVEDYLAFIGRLRRLEDIWDRVDDALEAVDMLERAEEYIGELSKGMRQRVGLAQALIHDPDVLILDEPTIGLDPAQIREVRQLIAELGRRHTILLSTHILSEVEQICSRVIMIFDGQIRADMTLAEMRAGGRGLLTARLGNYPVNAQKVLHEVPGVLEVSVSGDTFLLAVEDQDATPARVAEVVVGQGWALQELALERLDLENIFLSKMKEAEASIAGINREPSSASETSLVEWNEGEEE